MTEVDTVVLAFDATRVRPEGFEPPPSHEDQILGLACLPSSTTGARASDGLKARGARCARRCVTTHPLGATGRARTIDLPLTRRPLYH